jgi:hypothetical protein
MSSAELRSHIVSVPFEPFNVRTIDGRNIPVKNRDFILITPSGRHTYIFQPDDSRTVLDNELIVGIDFAVPPAASGTPSHS